MSPRPDSPTGPGTQDEIERFVRDSGSTSKEKPLEEVKIQSSHGTLLVDTKTGEPTHWNLTSCDRESIRNLLDIQRFNLTEWVNYWARPLPTDLDILDVGYHFRSATLRGYEEPSEEFRQQVASPQEALKITAADNLEERLSQSDIDAAHYVVLTVLGGAGQMGNATVIDIMQNLPQDIITQAVQQGWAHPDVLEKITTQLQRRRAARGMQGT